MSNFLITGGAGFIGSHIAEKLVKRGCNVRVFDDFSSGRRENLQKIIENIELIEDTILNIESLRKAMKGIDFVIHEGAVRSVSRSVAEPIVSNKVNVEGILNVLKTAKEGKVKRFVFASSSSVYGESKEFPQKEDDTLVPISPYAVSKLAGEYYSKVFTRTFGLETVILRYFNVFGPRQDPDSLYAAVIPKFILLILNGKRPQIYGDGTQSRDFSYIENVVEATISACLSEGISGETFNIACGETHSLLELVEELNYILGVKVKPVFLPRRLGDVVRTKADISKADAMINYKPKVKFREGLEKTIEFLKADLKR